MHNVLLQIQESSQSDPTNALFLEDTINAMLTKEQAEESESRDDRTQEGESELAVMKSAAMAVNLPNLTDAASAPVGELAVLHYVVSS